MNRPILFLLGAALSLTSTVFASDAAPWPGWRGPGGNGVAGSEAPLEWSPEKNILWKTATPGRGHSSPIVWDGLIVVTTAVQGKKLDEATAPTHSFGGQEFKHPQAVGSDYEYDLKVLAYEADSGKLAWEQTAYSGPVYDDIHSESSYASPTAVTDGERVYTYFGSEGVYAYEHDGAMAWKTDIGDIRSVGLGIGSSPVLAAGKVIVQADEDSGELSFIVALDAETGEEAWRQARPVQASWTTPFVLERDGKTQILTSGNEFVIAYDAENGAEVWRSEGLKANAIHVPMTVDDVVVFSSGYPQKRTFALRLEGEGEIATEQRLWEYNKGAGYVPSPVLYDGKLYLVSDGGVVTCLDAKTGEVVYEGGRPPVRGKLTASLVVAGDRILTINENSDAVWFKAGAEYEVLATNELDEPVYATPAVAGGRIYIRGNQHLYAIGESADD
ncbi:MAG: PQQ-binding-like beta-propeller repeat protein [Acidobacteriota bacterium]